MVVKIVVGSNFGDEGKGLMTDYFCYQAALRGEKCLVVCHNGGAQRGHTVSTSDGKHHVFHHFGSGVFRGSDTFLSKDFLVNPLVFRQEYDELANLGFKPRVYIHPGCKVTTPYDMILNQIIEESRGRNKHGSCGMGIYETEKRYEQGVGLSVKEYWDILQSKESQIMFLNYMCDIRDYVIGKLETLGIEISNGWKRILYSSLLMKKFLEDLAFMKSHIRIVQNPYAIYHFVVFEGGQGLLLDRDNEEYFPHLTPSHTGIHNPLSEIKLMLEDGLDPVIETCYVTRTYLTRHGNGRLDGECKREYINPNIVDHTNTPNPHQGTLRYGIIDYEKLKERIQKDFEPMKEVGSILSLAVTHLNEFPSDYTDDFIRSFDKIYESNGMVERAVKRLKDSGIIKEKRLLKNKSDALL